MPAWLIRQPDFDLLDDDVFAGTSANMPLRVVLTLLIRSTTSVPSMTLPNTA
jgi:hypothetical protein